MADNMVKYSAFISYKHGELDSFVAENLHKAIETFHVPKHIQKKTGKKRIERVFRDKEELPISSNLSDNISNALQHSEYLIVICSPRTPESYWVQKEIETFIGMHDRDHVLAVLIEGEPEESFPEMLRFDEKVRKQQDGTLQIEQIPVEPLAADLRAESKHAAKKKLRTEILRIMAPLLDCSYDDLRQRHRERKMRRTIGICTGLSACFLAFGLYSTYNTMRINQEYRVKQENQSRYLAETAQRLLDQGDRELAVKIALEALPESEDSKDRPYVPEAEYALAEALNTYATGDKFKAVAQLTCNGEVEEMILSPDYTLFAARDNMQNIYVWDAQTLEQLVHIEPVYDENYRVQDIGIILFNKENQLIYSCKKTVNCWDCQSNMQAWSVEFESNVNHLTMNRDKSQIAVANYYDCTLLDSLTGEALLKNENGNSKRNYCFSPDASYLAFSTSGDGKDECAIWNLKTNTTTIIENELWTGGTILDIEFVRNNELIISSSRPKDNSFSVEGSIIKYNVETLEPVWQNQESLSELEVYFLADDTQWQNPIIYSNNSEELFFLEVDTGELESISLSMLAEGVHLMSANMAMIVGTHGEVYVVFFMDGETYWSDWGQIGGINSVKDSLYSGNALFLEYIQDNQIVVCKAVTGDSYQACLEGVSPNSVKVSWDSQYLVQQVDSNLQILDRNYALLEEFPDVSLFWLCSEEDILLYVDADGILHRWNLQSGQEEEQIQATNSAYETGNSVYSEDGKWYAFICDSTLTVVNTLDMKESYTIPEVNINNMVICSDGQYVVGRYSDGSFMVYDMYSGKVVPLEENDYRVSDLTFVVQGTAIAVAHDHPWAAVWCIDNQIRIVDIITGKVISQFELLGAEQIFLSFTEDDSMVMASGLERNITFYDIQKEKIIKQISIENNELLEITFEPERNLCIIRELYGAYLITTKDHNYSIIAYIPSYKGIDPNAGKFYVSEIGGGLGCLQYQSLDQLIEKGKELVQYEELTDEEKRTYYVD